MRIRCVYHHSDEVQHSCSIYHARTEENTDCKVALFEMTDKSGIPAMFDKKRSEMSRWPIIGLMRWTLECESRQTYSGGPRPQDASKLQRPLCWQILIFKSLHQILRRNCAPTWTDIGLVDRSRKSSTGKPLWHCFRSSFKTIPGFDAFGYINAFLVFLCGECVTASVSCPGLCPRRLGLSTLYTLYSWVLTRLFCVVVWL